MVSYPAPVPLCSLCMPMFAGRGHAQLAVPRWCQARCLKRGRSASPLHLQRRAMWPCAALHPAQTSSCSHTRVWQSGNGNQSTGAEQQQQHYGWQQQGYGQSQRRRSTMTHVVHRMYFHDGHFRRYCWPCCPSTHLSLQAKLLKPLTTLYAAYNLARETVMLTVGLQCPYCVVHALGRKGARHLFGHVCWFGVHTIYQQAMLALHT